MPPSPHKRPGWKTIRLEGTRKFSCVWIMGLTDKRVGERSICVIRDVRHSTTRHADGTCGVPRRKRSRKLTTADGL